MRMYLEPTHTAAYSNVQLVRNTLFQSMGESPVGFFNRMGAHTSRFIDSIPCIGGG